MTLIRGRGLGLEVALAGFEIDEAVAELQTKLSERPDFYRGTSAIVSFDGNEPSPEHIERIRAVLAAGGIELEAIRAAAPPEELARRRAARPNRELRLSEGARSLVADFAGARADIAQRRKVGQGSVKRAIALARALPSAVPAAVPTLYHTGTVRGGQALHHEGNIVVVGDVNPGSELVASGDIVVFGRLAGVAHAGAKGDAFARVYALQLVPTQLRIATCIAAGDSAKPSGQAELAYVSEGRIAIVALDKLDSLPIAKDRT